MQKAILFCLFTFSVVFLPAQGIYRPNANLYFYFEESFLGGMWSGEIKWIEGKPYAHGKGKFLCKNESPGYTEQFLAFEGEVNNGKMHGYGIYWDNIDGGGFCEGDWSYGKPNGKMAIKSNSGNFIAGSFSEGKMYGEVAMKSSQYDLFKVKCNGLDLIKLLNNTYTSSNIPCEKVNKTSDALIGAAILISAFYLVTEKHGSLSDMLNCATQYSVSELAGNPVYASVASQAVSSLFSKKKYSWKDMAEDTIQNFLQEELKNKGYSNLANSVSFLTYLSCLVDEAK